MIAEWSASLKGKVCVVTGGTGVLGTALCEALSSSGVRVVAIGRNGEKAQGLAARLVQKYGTPAIGIGANVLDKPALETAYQEIIKTFGSVDLLINGAGGNNPKATTGVEQLTPESCDDLERSFFGLDIEAFESVFDLNCTGTILPTMIFARDMVKRREGAILNISSMSAFRPLTKIAAYSAAKASINNITQWLAVHFAKVNVRVNAIAPGFFLSEQNRFLLTDEQTGSLTPRGNKIIANTPMGAFGQPADVQGAALFLLNSATARFITGIILPVDGGFSAYSGV